LAAEAEDAEESLLELLQLGFTFVLFAGAVVQRFLQEHQIAATLERGLQDEPIRGQARRSA
jgi:hypothetical protein